MVSLFLLLLSISSFSLACEDHWCHPSCPPKVKPPHHPPKPPCPPPTPPYAPPTPPYSPPTPTPTPPYTPPYTPPTPTPTPPYTPPTPTPTPPYTPPTPTPPTPVPPKHEYCPIDALKLNACVDLLSGLIHIGIGQHVKSKCCPLIQGLVDLDAALCLCTTIRARLLNINIYLPIALELLITCGKHPPPGFQCPPLL